MKSKMKPTPLGDKVRFYRERTGLSQLQLSLKSGIATSTIGMIEQNKRNPSVTTVHKIGIALNLTAKEMSYLLDVNFYLEKDTQNKKNY